MIAKILRYTAVLLAGVLALGIGAAHNAKMAEAGAMVFVPAILILWGLSVWVSRRA